MLRTLLAQRGRCLTPAQWEFVAPRVAEEPTALYVRLALRTVGERMSWASDVGVGLALIDSIYTNMQFTSWLFVYFYEF